MPPVVRVSGQRRYPQASVDVVKTILFLRDVGFSLAEVKALIASRSVATDAWRDLARAKLVELDQQVARAEVARVALQHALRCKHEDLFDCPSFAGVLAASLAGRPLHEAHDHGGAGPTPLPRGRG
jgi:MerR family redox-sensitive transcriptional activator SoxR